MKNKHIVGIIILVIFVILFTSIFPALLIGGVFQPSINVEKAQKKFIQNENEIITIVEYLVNSEYKDGVCIYSHKNISEGSGKDIEIYDDEVIQAIKKLRRKGVSTIKFRHNTITFQMWANMDVGKGIAYTTDGNEPIIDYLTKTEKLSQDKWYYYEADYNEWRIREINNGSV